VGGRVSPAAAPNLIHRLALSSVAGNGDIHLMNSIIFPGDGEEPVLARIYDVVYLRAEAMAFSLGGARSFIRSENGSRIANQSFPGYSHFLKYLDKFISISLIKSLSLRRRRIARFLWFLS
jgi:hypothetical protein